VHAWVDRVHGERVRPFLIVPPLTVTPVRQAILSVNGQAAPLVVRVRAGADAVKGRVGLALPEGYRAEPESHEVTLERVGDEAVLRFAVTPPPGASGRVSIRPEARVVGPDGQPGQAWSFREDLVDYPHIPVQLVLQPAAVDIVPLALKRPEGLVGYLEGSADSVAEDLEHVGLRIELLDDATLRAGDLGRYSAIVVGIRAYNTRPIMRAAHPRLMRYVEAGGTLVVQYNTHSRFSPLDQPIGPFPLELSNVRVTDENASVAPVDASHPLLRAPNELGPADFEGWVQERGVYFASKWDSRYTPLFRMADPGEAPQEGSTLVARHGKGRYVYTGLAFFRQLRAGVPGAYRLMVNLLAPEKP
jgi:hypothetical protein